jgi:hypothetical protein
LPPYFLGIAGAKNPLESSGFVGKLFRDYGLLWLGEVEIPIGTKKTPTLILVGMGLLPSVK